jgi:hypothetical protein
MFDTNIFNNILDDKILLIEDKDIEYFVTDAQFDELNNTKDDKRKHDLLNIFKGIEQINIPITTHIWAYARWNTSTYGADELHKKLLKLLEEKKPNERGNLRDTLIGKTAIENGITLISSDKTLQESVKQLGGLSLSLLEFLNQIQNMP